MAGFRMTSLGVRTVVFHPVTVAANKGERQSSECDSTNTKEDEGCFLVHFILVSTG
jgi:hypothetical protein